MTPDELITRFRRDVDDIQHDPNDESDLLFTSDDVEFYLDEAHRQFVTDTLYLHEKLCLPVVAGYPQIALPIRFLEARGQKAYLATARRLIPEVNYTDLGTIQDDYGFQTYSNPTFGDEQGLPRSYSLDIAEGYITLFPTPEADDTFEILAFMEPPDVSELGTFAFRNRRHIVMLLDGMKALAYAKQDSDAYDPKQAQRWQDRFEDNILKVEAERRRRRRKPGVVQYGGL